jgi:hypothetical protein
MRVSAREQSAMQLRVRRIKQSLALEKQSYLTVHRTSPARYDFFGLPKEDGGTRFPVLTRPPSTKSVWPVM